MFLLHTSDRMKEFFPVQPVLAIKRDNNLQDILVHKKHNSMFFKQLSKCELCKANCARGPFIIESESFQDFRGKMYSVRNYINCKSEIVVYAIYCLKCAKFMYVGETIKMYQQMLLNFSRIRTQYDDPVAKYFYTVTIP